MRKSTWILSGTAVVLVAASAVTRFAVYPEVHQLPSDTDSVFAYTGTASLLNAAALEQGDVANAFLSDIPVTVERHVKVVDTDGGTAVVSDDVTVAGPDGSELSSTAHRWSVDRTDLVNSPVPEGSDAEEHQGLVISWPLEPEEKDYTFWDPTTATEAPAVYHRTEDLEGRTAYVFVVEAAGPLGEPAIAERLPQALPKDLLAGIAQTLPADQLPPPEALEALPDPVPLTYAATVQRTAWIDSETGMVLDGSLEQTIVAQTAGPDGQPVTLAPVNAMSLQGTAEGVSERADDAAESARMLWLVRVLAPLGLLGAAIVLLAVAAALEIRARRGTGTPEPGAQTA
ncbi:DUF3068 domain-containing protein [Streptomyces harbinensis]|uniref:porin PorA family protein n=1 Tax=Streptomyces harbinensis TaxID=1176198 RepID=UPI0015914C29|nr:porin PorA family protein [Streptomyces harbinensis]QKV71621.1 DUF3068 domain-containing protein [Streptomyces harbinensis]